MSKIKYYVFVVLVLCLFLPKVNALTYDIKTKLTNVDTLDNSYNITVSLDNISGTDYGIGACSLELDYSSGVVLNGEVKTTDSWTMTNGEIYVFDTGNPVKTNDDFLVIPVKVTKDGYIELKNIKCSDDSDEVSIANKKVNIKYNSNSDNNNNNNNDNDNDNNNGDDKINSGNGDNNVTINPETGVKLVFFVVIVLMIMSTLYLVYYILSKKNDI